MAGNSSFVVTVSQLNRRIAFLIKEDKSLANLSVSGEISNLSVKGGHMYFSLTEKTSSGETVSVKAVMFSSAAGRLGFRPENGMSVIVVGNVQCYERIGIYQIYANDMIPGGEGARAVALKQLREKLQAEGIFSRKRKLPEYPRRVCVITSESGAVLHDICENINPLVKLILIPASVQGEKAPESICGAFALANETDAELIIFGRGGGSSEDLSAFNDERVVRAVFNSRIPTISAVGHETDRSLTDYAADAYASTPTAAAKLAAPDKEAVSVLIDDRLSCVRLKLDAMINGREQAVGQATLKIGAKDPRRRLAAEEQLLEMNFSAIRGKAKGLISRKSDLLETRADAIKKSIGRIIEKKEAGLMRRADALSEKDPMKILAKGYSVVYKGSSVISRVSQLNTGDRVRIVTGGGAAAAEITEIFPEENI